MKTKIWEAIVSCLDENSSEPNIDELLTEAVMQAIESSQPTRLPVKYIGKRDSYSDGLYGTGEWETDLVKLVDVATAKKMFEHPDVYAPGEKEEATESVVASTDEGDNAEHLDEARQGVMAMTTQKAVKEFVANNFSGATLDLPRGTPIETYRLEAIRMIDQYHLPE